MKNIGPVTRHTQNSNVPHCPKKRLEQIQRFMSGFCMGYVIYNYLYQEKLDNTVVQYCICSRRDRLGVYSSVHTVLYMWRFIAFVHHCSTTKFTPIHCYYYCCYFTMCQRRNLIVLWKNWTNKTKITVKCSFRSYFRICYYTFLRDLRSKPIV